MDAFAGEKISGRVSRISPVVDGDSRQIPIEIIIPNREGKLGSGLLARVSFESGKRQQIVVPATALQKDDTLFVIKQQGEKTIVQARIVQIGDRQNQKVEIITGLKVGEKFVRRSSRPLKTDQEVSLSVLSESDTEEKRVRKGNRK